MIDFEYAESQPLNTCPAAVLITGETGTGKEHPTLINGRAPARPLEMVAGARNAPNLPALVCPFEIPILEVAV